jgi:hypothetical protein
MVPRVLRDFAWLDFTIAADMVAATTLLLVSMLRRGVEERRAQRWVRRWVTQWQERL